MSDIKISALPGASTLTGAETIPLVQGGTTKKVTTGQFLIKDASGNVGVGTASPVSKVHVEQYDYATAGLTFSAATETGRKYQLSMVTGGNFALTDTAAAVQRLVVDASGNLGLGVTPSAWSGVTGTMQMPDGGIFGFAGASGDFVANAYYNGGYKYVKTAAATVYAQTAGEHRWFTAPSGTAGAPISFTQAMTLDASGNLLVGVTSASNHSFRKDAPSAYVASVTNVSATAPNGLIIETGGTSAAGGYFLDCYNQSGMQMRVASTGNVVNTNNSYGAISDLKLKENITDASPKLSKLMQVRIVNYTLKSDPDKTKLIGVVAQELEKVSPGLIEETADFEDVKKTREVTKSVPVTEQVTVQREQKTVEVIDGKAVVTVTLVDEQTAVPVVDHYPLFDADGQPVLEVDTPEVPEALDKDGHVTQPAVPATYRQAMHSVPRMQDVTETEEYTERVPLGTVTKSVKYSVFVPMLVKAVQEQQTQIESLAARLAALEAKRWTR